MKYTGKTPVKARERVKLLTLDSNGDTVVYDEAIVIDPLSKQFTCRIPYRKNVRFYFYDDEGITWRKVV